MANKVDKIADGEVEFFDQANCKYKNLDSCHIFPFPSPLLFMAISRKFYEILKKD